MKPLPLALAGRGARAASPVIRPAHGLAPPPDLHDAEPEPVPGSTPPFPGLASAGAPAAGHPTGAPRRLETLRETHATEPMRGMNALFSGVDAPTASPVIRTARRLGTLHEIHAQEPVREMDPLLLALVAASAPAARSATRAPRRPAPRHELHAQEPVRR